MNTDEQPHGFRFSLRALFGAVFVCSVVCFVVIRLLLPAVAAAREASRRSHCTNNLKDIGIGLHNYHDIFATCPPAFLPDEHSRPIQSWRLLISLYLLQIHRLHPFHEYDRRQPWDNPKNKELAFGFVASYGNPFHCSSGATDPKQATTDFVAIVGKETAFNLDSPVSFDEIKDGLANTIVIGELAKSDIFWTEPRDLNFDGMSFRINDPSGNCISSSHPGGALALFADGSVHFVSNSADPNIIRQLCARNDGSNSNFAD